jgi:hypothetical protein
MVRLAPYNRERSIDLLQNNDTGELVRERKGTQTPPDMRSGDQSRIQPLRTANQQRERPGGKQPAFELTGQLSAGPAGTLSRQRNDRGALLNPGFQPGGLFGALDLWIWCAASLGNFLLPQGNVSSQAADVLVGGLSVVGPKFPDGDNGEVHVSAAAGPWGRGAVLRMLSRPFSAGLHSLPRCPAAPLSRYAYIPRSRCTTATRSMACI